MEKVILILTVDNKYSFTDVDVGLDYTNPFFKTKKAAIQAALKTYGPNCSFAGEGMTIYEAKRNGVKHAGDAFIWAWANSN
jgi:hypothetical protein